MFSYNAKIELSFKLLHTFIYLILIVVTIALSIRELKFLIISSRKNIHLEKEVNFFAQNPAVINTYLEEQKSTSSVIISNEFVLNNSQSNNQLIFILSLKCNYCKDMLREIQKVLYASINIQICLRFHFIDEEEKIILENIMTYYINGEKNIAIEALFSWFNMKHNKYTVSNWKEKYKNISCQKAKKVIQEGETWISQNNILGTPSIIINNKILPQYLNNRVFSYVKGYY